ncbi:UDP-glucose---hexose-1-phosphate uridylyltransferase [Chytriomyces confervae]|uniref:Galactose-1-phosphate uridylyltransferase n=1 Tax=Chytriomyces confervae TaxID=246404 RepID=A0A507FFV9_9FUNG|nr:UDP-glucose---hexose-1-phosphate uridylyltransferase [Chytriomyces confervae]
MEANNVHRRFNPLTRSWVLCSPHRAMRPWLGQKEEAAPEGPAYDPKCYLCPGNTRASNPPTANPSYESTFVFDNDFPALTAPEGSAEPSANATNDSSDIESLLFQSNKAAGLCRVVCFSPTHNLTLPEMSHTQVVSVVEEWIRIHKDLRSNHPAIHYAQIFENKGAVMGCSNPHPHGQVWATDYVPQEPRDELDSLVAFRKEHAGKCMLCSYAEIEEKRADRVVYSNNDFIVVVPYWAVWPFETMILSKTHVSSIEDLSESQQSSLADAILALTIRYDNLFETSFPYSMGIHGAPILAASQEHAHAAHLHLHFYPPLLRSASVKKFLVGFEMLGESQRDLTAEMAASRLRALSPVHYKKRSMMSKLQEEREGGSPNTQSPDLEVQRLITEHTSRHGKSLDPTLRYPATPKSESNTKQVVFAVSFYITTAIVMVLVNKAVLNTVALPLTFLWVQLLVAVLLLSASSYFGVLQCPIFTTSTCRALAPLIVINVVGLALNTFCLQHVDASFFQVARSLVLPFTMLMSWLFLGQKSSAWVLISCAAVFTGFIVGTLMEDKDIVVSQIGIVFGIASSLTTAGHSIVIKHSYSVVRGNTLDLVYYNNVMSLLLLTPVVLMSGEVEMMLDLLVKNNKVGAVDSGDQLKALGVFGFLINIAGFFQIKVTSPVTHMISSAFRGVLQTLLAVAFFHDILTSSRIMSIAMILFGSCLYAWVSSQENAVASGALKPAERSSPGYQEPLLFGILRYMRRAVLVPFRETNSFT